MTDSKIKNIAPTAAPTRLVDVQSQVDILAILEGVAEEGVRRIRKAGYEAAQPLITIAAGDSGADGVIYSCKKTGERRRGEKNVNGGDAAFQAGKIGQIHISRFHSDDARAQVVSVLRGLSRITVAAAKGKEGTLRNFPAKSIQKYYDAVGLACKTSFSGSTGGLVDVGFKDSSWLVEISELQAVLDRIAITPERDSALLDGSKRGGDQTSQGEEAEEAESKGGASSAVSLDFGTPEALAGVRAYFGASTNSALSVILADLVKAQMATGKVPLKIAN